MDVKKYKWLYLWIAAAGLLVFGLLMLFIQKFGQSVVLFVSAALLIAFVIIRFVPLIKTTKNRWAICANAIEMFIDLAVGVIILVLTIKYIKEDKNINDLGVVYAFMLGGVLYLRGLEYLVETTFFGTKPEVVKFLIHILLLSVGTVIFSRYDNFTTESFRWLLGFAFCICGGIAIVDGGTNYSKYRKTYEKKPKKNKKEDVVVDEIKTEIPIVDNQEQPTIVA